MVTPGKVVVMECGSGKIGRILRDAGFEIATGVDSREVVAIFRTFRPETAVLHVAASPDDALELTHRLKASPETAAVPVLHVAPAGREPAVRSLECADACLQEPVDPPVLTAAVAALVRHYRSPEPYSGTGTLWRSIAENALRESEERYRLLFETSPIGVASALIDGGDCCRILDANDAWLSITGYSREDLRDLDWRGIASPESRPAAAAATERFLATGRSGLYEEEIVRKDGTRVPVKACRACAGERREWAVAFLIDVTEQKRLEAQLHDSQEMESIGVLAGGVAHDFNNLLTTILGNASLVAERLSESSQEFSRMQQIIQSGEHAADLTRQLLAYAGKGGFVTTDIDLADVVCDVIPLFRGSIPGAIALDLDLHDGVPAVRADRSQVHQVLMNLLLNASEACGDGPGLIAVRTGTRIVGEAESRRIGPRVRAGRYAVIEVRDSGCGIDAATLPRIFEPFFTTKFAGRGLGLAALQGIVRRHRGFVEVESTPGEGSLFRVMLPEKAGPDPDGPA